MLRYLCDRHMQTVHAGVKQQDGGQQCHDAIFRTQCDTQNTRGQPGAVTNAHKSDCDAHWVCALFQRTTLALNYDLSHLPAVLFEVLGSIDSALPTINPARALRHTGSLGIDWGLDSALRTSVAKRSRS